LPPLPVETPRKAGKLEGDRIVDRRSLELVLEVENPVHIEQQRPHGTVGLDPSRLAGLLQKLDEPSLPVSSTSFPASRRKAAFREIAGSPGCPS